MTLHCRVILCKLCIIHSCGSTNKLMKLTPQDGRPEGASDDATCFMGEFVNKIDGVCYQNNAILVI